MLYISEKFLDLPDRKLVYSITREHPPYHPTGQHYMNNRQNTEAVDEILQTADHNLFWTWSFVLTALQIPHQRLMKDDVFHLLVPQSLKERALKEIEEYSSENSSWPRKAEHPKQNVNSLQPPTLLLVGSLALFYSVTGPWDGNSLWFQQGAGNSQAMLEHSQWYRLITSLTLHADIIHLLNNCILGGFLLHFFFLLVGSGIGLFALLCAAAAGNYINVVLHGPGHIFVGFSTAIFAVIGLLSMLRYSNNYHTIGTHVFVPLMAGIALLAMLGSSGERTDLGAHFFGLVSGLLFGKILGLQLIRRLKDALFVQTLLFLSSLFTILASWILALQT
jgi:rhomboid protease GluP